MMKCKLCLELIHREPEIASREFIPILPGVTLLSLVCARREDAAAKLLEASVGLDSPEILHKATPFGITALHFAASMGFHGNVKALLNHRACVHLKRKDNGRTSLHMAARNGYPTVVKLLIQHRAEVNCVDNFQYTPLHLASHALALDGNSDPGDRTVVVAMLLGAKAQLSAEASGETAAMIAVDLCFEEALHLVEPACRTVDF